MSVHYLEVIEFWKQKSLLLDNWGPDYLALDSQIPLAKRIYSTTKSFWSIVKSSWTEEKIHSDLPLW